MVVESASKIYTAQQRIWLRASHHMIWICVNDSILTWVLFGHRLEKVNFQFINLILQVVSV